MDLFFLKRKGEAEPYSGACRAVKVKNTELQSVQTFKSHLIYMYAGFCGFFQYFFQILWL